MIETLTGAEQAGEITRPIGGGRYPPALRLGIVFFGALLCWLLLAMSLWYFLTDIV